MYRSEVRGALADCKSYRLRNATSNPKLWSAEHVAKHFNKNMKNLGNKQFKQTWRNSVLSFRSFLCCFGFGCSGCSCSCFGFSCFLSGTNSNGLNNGHNKVLKPPLGYLSILVDISCILEHYIDLFWVVFEDTIGRGIPLTSFDIPSLSRNNWKIPKSLGEL